jgi:hypothetical protein
VVLYLELLPEMNPDSTHLAERLRVEGQKTCDFFRQLSPDQLEQVVYSEGAGWTVYQVLVHVVGAEAAMYRLVQNILQGGAGVPEDFDLNRYNEHRVNEMAGTSCADLLEKYMQRRQQIADLVLSLGPDDLAKTGRHPFLGIATVEKIIKLFYRHDQIHIREIRNVLG